MTKTVHLDYEFRSGVDINDVGSHRASIDPEFEILMAAVSGEGVDDPVFLWINPKFRTPDMMGQNEEAEALLNSADIVYAHNAPNEQANTWGALSQGKACPFWKEPPLTIWRCTAAMSRKAGLPNALGDVADFLGTPVKKDKRGRELIKLFCTKNETKLTKEEKKAGKLTIVKFIEPIERQEEFITFGAYCCDDVRAEKHVHKRLKPFDLSGAQLEMFQFDLRMNQRGIPINLAGAQRAQRLINQVQSVVIREFRQLTGLNPTQRQKTQEWLFEHGCPMENMQAATVEEAIEKLRSRINDPLADEEELKRDRLALRVIELYQKVSYSAVAKIQTMIECVCPDGRVRGGHMFYGAGTGRWSGKLLQPQNFKKTPVELKDITDAVYKAICDGWSPEMIDQIYGDPLEMLSICIRHFIFHPQYQMLDGDYNAVEARIICWLAGQEDALEEYRTGVDRYQIMASVIYQQELARIKSLGKDSKERQVGKQAVLGCGFGLGREEKFRDTVKKQAGIDIPLDLAGQAIKAFRKKHPKIVSYWWQLDGQCKNAVRTPGVQFGPFVVKTIAGVPFMLFYLRSGRALAYPRPKIELFPWTPKKRKFNPDDDGYDDGFAQEGQEQKVIMRENVVYWGEIKPRVWGWIKLYGGKLAENETQATAADFMGAGAIEAERQGMEPFMLVHDQALALITDPDRNTVEAFERALGTLPVWAKGMPLKVEGNICRYYRK